MSKYKTIFFTIRITSSKSFQQQQQHQNKLEIDLQNSTVDLPSGTTTEIQELTPHHDRKRIHPALPATTLLKNIKKQPD